jgi:hypothetical protein
LPIADLGIVSWQLLTLILMKHLFQYFAPLPFDLDPKGLAFLGVPFDEPGDALCLSFAKKLLPFS